MENSTHSLLFDPGEESASPGSHLAVPVIQAYLHTPNVTNSDVTDVTDYVTHDITHDDMSRDVTGGGLPMSIHITVGVIMVIVFLLGTIGNLIVIIVFGCFRSLRKPMNMLLVNLAVADLLMAGCGSPMVAISSFYGHWILGDMGCKLYAYFMGHCGLASIVTMSAIALERVCGVASYHLKSPLQRCGAPGTITIIWCYSSIWVLPPLFGWGEYKLENYGTACSFKFQDVTQSDRSFLVYLFTGGFVVPCCIILVCYILLWSWVVHNQRAFHRQASRMETSVHLMRMNTRSNIELRVTKVCLLVVLVFHIAWVPYAIITLMAAFGGKAQQALITPFVCMLPGIFAKMSSIYNPILYTVSHPAFKQRLHRLVCHQNLSDSPSLVNCPQTCPTTPMEESSRRRSYRKSGVSAVNTPTFASCRPVFIMGEEEHGVLGPSGSDSEGVSMLHHQTKEEAIVMEVKKGNGHILEAEEDSHLMSEEQIQDKPL